MDRTVINTSEAPRCRAELARSRNEAVVTEPQKPRSVTRDLWELRQVLSIAESYVLVCGTAIRGLICRVHMQVK